MNISLTPQLEKLVEEKVQSGQYMSHSEVVRDALRLLDERDEIRAQKLEALRREVAIGIEQADRGETSPLDLDEIHKEVLERVEHYKKSNR